LFDKIFTARPEDYSESVSLGGTTLYATEEGILGDAVEKIEGVINNVTLPHLTLIKNSVGKLTRESFSEPPTDKIFGAVFGKMLRLGRIKAITCMTENVRVYPVFLNSSNAEKLADSLEVVKDMLCTSKLVSTREVRRRLFPDEGWGTWPTANNLLQHLAFLGYAIYQDRDSFYWPADIEDAIS